MADKIICTPQIMEQVAKSFDELDENLTPHANKINEMRSLLIVDDGGSWQGKGRDAFEEKFQEVLKPAWNDVRDALKAGAKLSNMLLATMSEGVEESTNLLKQIAIQE